MRCLYWSISKWVFVLWVCLLCSNGAYSEDALSPYTERDRAIFGLQNEDPLIAYQAERVLEALGEESLPSLINILSSLQIDTVIRARAARVIGRIGSKSVPPLGPEWMEHQQTDRQRKRNLVLPTVPFLVAALKEKDYNLKYEAVVALGRIQSDGSQAVSALAENLLHPYKDIRHEVVIALGKIGPKAELATPELIASMNLNDMRFLVVHALGQIGLTGYSLGPVVRISLFEKEDLELQAEAKRVLQIYTQSSH